jgi:hypothetical protein
MYEQIPDRVGVGNLTVGEADQYGKRISTGSGSKFQPLYFETYLLLTTIMEPLPLSNMFSSIPSSSSSPILGVLALVVRLFLVFLFDAFASASSISPRIFCVSKTVFSFIATCFPLLRYLSSLDSSLASANSLPERAFLEVVFPRADSDRSIYCFTGVSVRAHSGFREDNRYEVYLGGARSATRWDSAVRCQARDAGPRRSHVSSAMWRCSYNNW